jgi:hypothetical protein
MAPENHFPDPRGELLKPYTIAAQRGYESVKDAGYELDFEPQWVPPDVKDHYFEIRYKWAYALRYGFICPHCGSYLVGGASAAKLLRAHLWNFAQFGKCWVGTSQAPVLAAASKTAKKAQGF